MRVLVIGSGGREHALVWKIRQSPLVDEVFVIPGNPGMEGLARRLPGDPRDVGALVRLAEDRRIDLTVVGPEDPLAAGLVDAFTARGLAAFGPTAAATAIESSKVFAKDLMRRSGIPTANYRVFEVAEEARDYVSGRPEGPLVVKADGLSAGKGVIIARDRAEALAALNEAMVRAALGSAGRRVVVEEFLVGEEVSVFAICDGQRALPLAAAEDHKAVYDGDRGPNTGGMGAFSPVPAYTSAVAEAVGRTILDPIVQAMARVGRPFRGILFAGLMLTAAGPKVLEFNARLGDPETQAVLPRIKGDLVPVLLAAARGSLDGVTIDLTDEAAVCVVMASGGYPGRYVKGRPITGLGADLGPGVTVFHAGTSRDAEGRLCTSGGRVLGVTATAAGLEEAIARAYAAVDLIHFEGTHYRRDIGHRKAGLRETGFRNEGKSRP
ncbi:MAG TPA: phosphoribosylamine--glycine ligase [Bacillota bacterium]|jgi:phosphoribosylamine--glycine ligase